MFEDSFTYKTKSGNTFLRTIILNRLNFNGLDNPIKIRIKN